jgi:hypothetical protein
VLQKQILKFALATAVLAAIIGLAPTVSAAPYAGHPGMQNGWTIGTISSIQSGETPKSPTWVLSGHWSTNMINKTKRDFNQSNPAKFDALFTMVLLNGSARHNHNVSDFILNDVKSENGTVSYTGNATVTLKAGPVKDVPTEIKIFNNNVVSIWFNPVKVNKHFGESPIYGVVLNKKNLLSRDASGPHKGNTTMTASSSSSPSF